MLSKKPWMSKSIWVGLVVAAAPFIPWVGDVINESIALSIIGAVMILLRLVTKTEIKLID